MMVDIFFIIVFLVFGPVAQTGRAPPLQGGGPGFKSRWVHLLFYDVNDFMSYSLLGINYFFLVS